ncbi:carotenoid ester lipase precursor [Clavulina sp. PMI_390]|nr:carotenoid ester lipase precursor [Clavulina sp. PMI_390]
MGQLSLTHPTVASFLGIPFAKRIVGDLRFQLPVANDPYNSTFAASSMGPACIQQAVTLPIISGLPADAINAIVNTIYGAIFPDSEDCLTINVWKPATATSTSKLPVFVWIFGGGFELGATSTYPGDGMVDHSITMGQPVIFVSMNYRLNGPGFMGGKEIKAAGVGNLGLQDQRQALRWVQKYISAFGGDPTKVTIGGESAGAISVALQMLNNGGNNEGLFRGAWMESGSPIPVGDITHVQIYYDQVVSLVGCSSASDTLACLRTVPYDQIKAAINKTPNIFSYQSLDLAWLPRVDGVFLTEPPFEIVQSGAVANVPMVTGDCDDEGTLFVLTAANVTTDEEFETYMTEWFLPDGTPEQVAAVLEAYPQDPTQGSPYDTGYANDISPQYKRGASVLGDLVFQGPRRWFLQHIASKQNAWSFSYKRSKDIPILGAFHATDLLNMFGTGELRDYAIAFTNSLDPNGAKLSPSWPTWSTSAPVSLVLLDTILDDRGLLNDTYRQGPIDLLNSLALQYPI